MTLPPQQYHVNDPDFDPSIGYQLKVYLDDQQMDMVLGYNIEEGWIEYYPLNDFGNVMLTPEGDTQINKAYGAVRVTMS